MMSSVLSANSMGQFIAANEQYEAQSVEPLGAVIGHVEAVLEPSIEQ